MPRSDAGEHLRMSAPTVELLDWDSRFFGFTIARIAVEAPSPRDLEAAIETCRDREVRCAYLLLDAADIRASEHAQALGFVLRDVRVELDRPITPADATLDAASVVPAGPQQLPALEQVARERITMSRFFADPGFARERCRELYVAFLRRGSVGSTERWTLAPVDDSGFIVCHVDAARRRGTIELVASRRRGGGGALVRAAVGRFSREGATCARVVTQAHNIAAQRTYQRVGFRTVHTSLWLHYWLD